VMVMLHLHLCNVHMLLQRKIRLQQACNVFAFASGTCKYNDSNQYEFSR
jgi:hypothetical protein